MPSPQTIQAILEKHLRETLIPAEQQQLQDWLHSSEANQALFDRLNDDHYVKGLLEKIDQVDEDRVLHKIANSTGSAVLTGTVRRLNPRKRSMVWAAAILLLLLTGAGYLIFRQSPQQEIVNRNHEILPNNIPPGKDGAVLTLADGSTVILDSLGHGVVTTQGNTKVVLKDGKLSYENNAKNNTGHEQLLSNTMTTPKGRQYQLILPDGSKVWLNAASSITYPTAFTGPQRKVTITGEAYFEITRDKSKPFLVQTDNMLVEVLGTRFNINSYRNEETIKTTLLEGSVNVKSEVGSPSAAGGLPQARQKPDGSLQTSDLRPQTSILLKPGQQARLATSQPLLVQPADLDEVMAWINGVFSFREADIQTVMRQLERWYDIEVKYIGAIPKDRFSGKVSRSVNLAQVLKILEFSDVSFRIEGKMLIVIPPPSKEASLSLAQSANS